MNSGTFWRSRGFLFGLLVLSCGRPAVPADWSAKEIGEELNSAIDRGDMAKAEQLVDAGLRLKLAEKVTSEEEKLTLEQAIAGNRFARVKQLLQGGADPNKPLVQRYPGVEIRSTPLGVASVSVPMTELLLRNGANIEQTVTTDARTPLAHAASSGKQRTALWLLHRKANPKALTQRGESVLHLAVQHANAKFIETLLDAGLDIEARTPRQQEEPEGVVNPDPRDWLDWRREGGTPLLYAAGSPETADLLIKRGANPKAVDEEGAGMLHYAAAGGFPQSVEFALKLGLDVNSATIRGVTPLHVAAATSPWFESEQVETLLKAGAKRDARDAKGRTPADVFRMVLSNRLKGIALTKSGVERAMGNEIARGNKLLKLLDPTATPITAPTASGKAEWVIYPPIKLWNEAEVGTSPVIRRQITAWDDQAILKLTVDSAWKGSPVEIRNLWVLGYGSKEESLTLAAGQSRELTFPLDLFVYGGAMSFDWRTGRNSGRYQSERYALPPGVSDVVRGDKVFAVSDDPFGRQVHFRVIKLIQNDKVVSPERKEGVLSASELFIHSAHETGFVELDLWLDEEQEGRKVRRKTGEFVRWSSSNPFLPTK